jgi:hypothetical protein
MKRRFEFRLERVRAVRALEERVARAERVQAETVARAAEASRDRARDLLASSREHLRATLGRAVEPRAVLAAQRALDGELEALRRRLESARTLRIQAERLAAAQRERRSAARALDELRERAREAHRADLEKHDNAELDEVAQRLAHGTRRPPAGATEDPSRSETAGADQGSDVPRPRAS